MATAHPYLGAASGLSLALVACGHASMAPSEPVHGYDRCQAVLPRLSVAGVGRERAAHNTPAVVVGQWRSIQSTTLEDMCCQHAVCSVMTAVC